MSCLCTWDLTARRHFGLTLRLRTSSRSSTRPNQPTSFKSTNIYYSTLTTCFLFSKPKSSSCVHIPFSIFNFEFSGSIANNSFFDYICYIGQSSAEWRILNVKLEVGSYVCMHFFLEPVRPSVCWSVCMSS